MVGVIKKYPSQMESHFSRMNFQICIGNIVSLTENGQFLVNFPENPFGPLIARYIDFQLPNDLKVGEIDKPVLLAFDRNDLKSPIIIGFLNDTYHTQINKEKSNLSSWQGKDIFVDGDKLIINAQEEIVLKCGKSSIILGKDGKIVLKGVKIASRASDTNKIKGSTVNIN